MTEYLQRLDRLRVLLGSHNMDAVLLSTGGNLRYFSGYPSPVRSVPRPFFLLLSVEREPIFFTHTGHASEARRFSWIEDIRTYKSLSRVPVDLLRDALSEHQLLGKTIGMELGFEQTLDFSHSEFCRLRNAVSGTIITDAAPILWQLRMIKSKWEISCIQEACRITDAGYATTFRLAQSGMPEQDLYFCMRDYLAKHSGGDLFLAITSGQSNYDLVTKPPDARPLTPGDLVWMDAGCTVQGYWSDFSRAGTVGAPSDAQRFAQAVISRITGEALAHIRPGVAASSIWTFCAAELEKLRFPITSSITQLAARVGHGMGLAMTEPPHLGPDDNTILEAGMVLTIEPGVATKYGTFHVEENVVVTTDGCEVLSNAPRQLQEILS